MSTSLRSRPARVAPATITALIILVIAALLLWWGIASLREGSLVGAEQLSAAAHVSAADTAALAIAGVVTAVGLVLLLTALIPGSQRLAPVTPAQGTPADTGTGTQIALTTSGLANLAASVADQVDGVDSVSVSATARHVRARLTTPVRDHADIRREVEQAITARLGELGLTRTPRVSVTARVKELT